MRLLLNYLDILKIQNTYIADIHYSYKKYCDIVNALPAWEGLIQFKLLYLLSISYPFFQGIDYFINKHIFINICNKKHNIFYKIYNLKSKQLGRGGSL